MPINNDDLNKLLKTATKMAPKSKIQYTDMERLHKVASGELIGRQVGKTFLRCHELCGLVGCNIVTDGKFISWN